ncbi:MAG: hypothetical protein IKC11_03575 [Clostridia bacterium]|nr:hypothetical protein [Clostridia bacterium]
MIEIKTKKESLLLIEKLGLNKLPEVYLKVFDKEKVSAFLKKYPAKFYAVRSKSQAGSKIFNFKVKQEDVISYVENLTEFTINVSSFGFSNWQLCTGEVKIEKDMKISVCVSNNPEFSARDAGLMPDYNFVSTLEDPKVKSIKGLKEVVDYIFKYELFGIIVEFASFDRFVGIKDEKVVIFELRTAY